MQPDRIELVRSIAAEVLAASPHLRDVIVRDRCGPDHSLRDEVLRAVEAASQVTMPGLSGVEPSVLRPTETLSNSEASHSPRLGRIGKYTLLEVLGEGGMGLVYLARQDGTERTVALKVIRPGFGSPSMLRRFELEGRTLAKLQHPCIAQIFDAGVDRSAVGPEHPYVALEHVRGVDIRTHADGRTLTVSDRVRLMIKVCHAVQHAHAKGVIHRDIKPGNILIDGAGSPKVLDFGVARLTEQSEFQPFATQAGQIVGTVPYMSPEQIAGDPDAVDTRTDVYALGVVLYELLTGRLPHDVAGKTIVEAAKQIEHEPVTPIRRLVPSLSGDLQTVVSTAIRKDRSLRYQSAADLAADLERHLRNEPIRARPASVAYVTGKFVRRNRTLVALGVVVVVLAFAGAVGITWQAVRATRGWDLARAESAAASAATEFLVRTISSADPEHNLGESLTVRQVLDQMAAQAALELHQQPRVEWSVQGTLARTYRGLDALADAERHSERTIELARGLFGQNSIEAIRAEGELSMILAQSGQFDRAERIARWCLDAITTHYGREHPDRSVTLGALARVLQETGRWTEAEPLLRESVELGARVRGEKDPEVLVSIHNLATALKDAGHLDESERLLRRVLDLRNRVHGESHPQTAYSMNNLAATLQRMGRNEEALDLLMQTLTVRESTLGPDHQSTLTTRMNAAVCLISLGRIAEAEPHVRAGLDGYLRTLGEQHAKTLIAMGNLAYLLEEQEEFTEAEAVYRRVVDLRRTTQGGRDPETWAAMNNLAMLLRSQGKFDEAEPMLRELVEMCEEALPAGHYYTAIFANNYADLLVDLGRLDEAELLLRESLSVIVGMLGENHPRAERGRERLVRLNQIRIQRRAENE